MLKTVVSTRARRRALLFTGIAAAVLAAGVPALAATSTDQQVSYLGLTFQVPSDWQVVDLTPTTCVRFDRHVVYLGTPGTAQECPSGAVARSEGLLVQPATGTVTTTTTTSTDDTVSRVITVTTPAVRITAPYAQDRAAVTAALGSAGLPAPAPETATPPSAITPHAAAATLPLDATNGFGQGFDTCTAPAAASMSAWMGTSPFTSVGVYIGGADEACPAGNPTAAWMSAVASMGWHFMPVYVGQQAAFGDITNPRLNGTQDADQAVTNAKNLGLPAGSILYYDMENYPAAARGQAMMLETAWTAELHRLGYMSGIYGSANSGIADLVANAGGPSTPDVVFTARYNGVASTDDPVLLPGDFSDHQRIHQYQGGTNETYNKVTINVDLDYLDVGVADGNTAPQESGLVPTIPTRLLDTRNKIGVNTTTPLGAGTKLVLPVTGKAGIPSDVTAVVLNVTAVNPSATSYLSVFPDGDVLPSVSSINFTPGRTVPNLVTVPVVDGSVDIYNHVGTVHALADLVGYYRAAQPGQLYRSVTPARMLDTRNGIGVAKARLGAHSSLTVSLTGGAAQIPADAAAVVMNVTAVNPSTSSYLTAYPAGTAVPGASNLNFVAGQTVSNLVVVPVTNGSVSIYNNSGTTDVIGDVMGYYASTPGNTFEITAPARLLDTRNGTGRAGKVGALGTRGTLKLTVAGVDGVPSFATAVVLNVTAVNPTAAGYLTVYADGQARPNVSNINFPAGRTIANQVIVPVTNGSVDIYNNAGNTGVTADVAGFFVH